MENKILAFEQPPCLLRNGGGMKNECFCLAQSDREREAVLTLNGTGVWRGMLVPGENRVRFTIPEPAEPSDAQLSLSGVGTLGIHIRVPRRWEVHVVQFSHHDPGYTDVPSHVLEESAAFLKQALDDMDAREDAPEDARYRIVAEQTYSLAHFLRTAQERDRRRMIERIRRGDVEVTALWANLISELLSPEEMLRALYPAEEIARETGVPILAAEHNDIPGFSWGYCTALCRAGIKFFVPGLPDYYGWGGKDLSSFWEKEAMFPNGLPGAFWWESAEGERLLFWCSHTGCGGTSDPGLPDLIPTLMRLEQDGYPHAVYRLPVQGANRDNSPYSPAFSDFIRRWNETYAYPHLICSTETKFYNAFTESLAEPLPVFRGGVDGQDYPTASTSQMSSSALNRANHALFRSSELLYAAAKDDPVLHDQTKRLRSALTDMLMADEHAFGFTFPACPGQRASCAEHSVYAARANADFHDVLAKSMASVADRVQADGDGYRLTVFNTSGVGGLHRVQAPLRDPDNCGTEIRPSNRDGLPRIYELGNRMQSTPQEGFLEGKFRLRDRETGEFVPYTLRKIGWDDPCDLAAERAGIGAGTNRFGFFEDPRGVSLICEFTADLPACGYRTFDLVPCEEPAFLPTEKAEESVGNEFYRVFFDETGILDIRGLSDGDSLFDKACPHKPLSLLVRYGSEEQVSEGKVASVSAERNALGETVTLKGTADGIYEYTLALSLYFGIDNIFVSLRAVKSAKPMQTVFLCFPFAGDGVTYQGAFFEGKPVGPLLPGSHSDAIAVQDWVKTGESDILWSSLNAPVTYLSHLWEGYISPAHRGIHDYKKRTPLRREDFDTGSVYSLLTCNNFDTNFFASQLSDAVFSYVFAKQHGRAPSEWGQDAQSPVTTILTDRSRGSLPASAEILAVPGLRVLTLKPAENGNGLILRLKNDAEREISTTVSLWGKEARILCECDALERELRPVRGSRIAVPAGKLAAFRLAGTAE